MDRRFLAAFVFCLAALSAPVFAVAVEGESKNTSGGDFSHLVNLVAAKGREKDSRATVQKAALSVLSRPSTAEAEAELAADLDAAADRKQASADIVGVLLTTAEFRFNH